MRHLVTNWCTRLNFSLLPPIETRETWILRSKWISKANYVLSTRRTNIVCGEEKFPLPACATAACSIPLCSFAAEAACGVPYVSSLTTYQPSAANRFWNYGRSSQTNSTHSFWMKILSMLSSSLLLPASLAIKSQTCQIPALDIPATTHWYIFSTFCPVWKFTFDC